MAGVVKERIRDWMRRCFPSDQENIRIFECADVIALLEPGDSTGGVASREGMLFTSRDRPVPAPRRELVILTNALASYSAERIIRALEQEVRPLLEKRPAVRVLLDDELRILPWGKSSDGSTSAEDQPCKSPRTPNHSAPE